MPTTTASCHTFRKAISYWRQPKLEEGGQRTPKRLDLLLEPDGNNPVRQGIAYYGITGSYRSLRLYWHRQRQSWRYWLNRCNRENRMTWERFLTCSRTIPYQPRMWYIPPMQQDRNLRNRVQEICSPGSVGAPWRTDSLPLLG